jgi:hypothetical protein
MDHVSFDALSRRASLMTLGAGLAGFAGPIAAKAKKKKGKGNDKCKKQVGACREGIADLCPVVTSSKGATPPRPLRAPSRPPKRSRRSGPPERRRKDMP